MKASHAAPVAAALRPARTDELDALARLWYDGWQDAHAAILPEALRRVRTLPSFRMRLRESLPRVRVAEMGSEAVGFAIVEDDELYQLFVSAAARGTGTAAALVADAEEILAAAGVETAWLACAIGNRRAARFYEKCGWRLAGEMVNPLPMPDGSTLELRVWRYEKRVR